MLITGKVLDIVVSTKDNAYALALSAFNESHNLSMNAKESEIRSLKEINAGLSEALKYERARADALVDRLLQKEAHVAAVAPLAAHVAKHQDEAAVKKLNEIFESLNDVGEVPPPSRGAEGRAFEMAGGSAVAA